MPWFAALDRDDAADARDFAAGAIAAPVPFTDAVGRGFSAAFDLQRAGARQDLASGQLWDRSGEIYRRTGQRLAPSRSMLGHAEGWDEMGFALARAPDDDAYEAEVDKLRADRPKEMAGIKTRAELAAVRDARLKGIAERAAEVDAGGGFGVAGAALGGLAGSLADPANLVATVATGGWGAGRGLITRMLAQGAANAGIEIAQQPIKAAEAAKFGGPAWTPGQAAADVALAGVAGVGFEAGFAGLRALWKAGARAADPAVRGAAHEAERGALAEAAIGADRAGPEYDEALHALDTNAPPPAIAPARDLTELFGDVPPTVGDVRQLGPAAVSARVDYQGRPIYASSFDPAEVEVAPRTFQYKADADGEGVTARLRGVEAWDATASGKAIVWEAPEGHLVIADGHQRRALARRMLDKGWEDVRLDGYLFRAADGWTAREVRVVAALKNIREGSGTILDAAKVFRDAPEALGDRSLPVTGEFIGQARALAKLSPEAFGAVVNRVIPERYAAEIGLVAAHRPDLHDGMVRLLKAGDPATADEARALVMEALQDDWIRSEGETADLFGYDPSVSAMVARAKVAAAVKRALGRDARLYGQLVKHADAIEAGGNALARDLNEARLAADRAALELTAKLALRDGPIGEAMAGAAQRVAKGEAAADAAKGVVQRIRKALAEGEKLDDLRGATLNPEPPPQAARDLLSAFDDPHGAGVEAQLKPKPEEAELEGDGALSGGLFDDLEEVGAEAQAHQRLLACAPGG